MSPWYLFSLPPITSLLGSSSISLFEDGDEGTEPCEGLYLNVRVLVFQTGSSGWATPHSEGQNRVCNKSVTGFTLLQVNVFIVQLRCLCFVLYFSVWLLLVLVTCLNVVSFCIFLLSYTVDIDLLFMWTVWTAEIRHQQTLPSVSAMIEAQKLELFKVCSSALLHQMFCVVMCWRGAFRD